MSEPDPKKPEHGQRNGENENRGKDVEANANDFPIHITQPEGEDVGAKGDLQWNEHEDKGRRKHHERLKNSQSMLKAITGDNIHGAEANIYRADISLNGKSAAASGALPRRRHANFATGLFGVCCN